MRAFKSYTLQTTVLIIGLFLFAFSAQAQNNTDNTPRCENEEKAALNAVKRSEYGGEFAGISDTDAFINKMQEIRARPGGQGNIIADAINTTYESTLTQCRGTPSVANNNSESCNEASRKFAEEKSKFSASCGKARLGSDNLKRCAEDVQKCNSLPAARYSSSSSKSSVDPIQSFANAFTGQQPATGSTRSVTPDLEDAQDRFKQCPVFAAEDLETWRKSVEDSDNRVKELDEKILAMQDELTELNTEMARRLKEIKDQMTEVQEQAEDDAEQIRLDLQEFDSSLAEQVTQLESRISDQNRTIEALNSAKVEAYNSFQAAQTSLNLQCHAAALQKVDQLQKEKRTLMAASRYSAGGFNSLLGSVGLSNQKAAEQLAKKYYDSCINDRAYVDNLKIAERGYKLATENADKAVAQARDSISRIQEQITKVQGELKLKGLENFQRRLERLQNRLVTRMQQLQESYVLEAQQFAAQIANKQKALQQAQTDLATAKNYLSQRQAYYDLKNQMSGGNDISSADVSELVSSHSKASSAAKDVFNACRTVDESKCESALELLGDVYGSSDCRAPSYSSPTGGGSGPAGPTPTSPGGSTPVGE